MVNTVYFGNLNIIDNNFISSKDPAHRDLFTSQNLDYLQNSFKFKISTRMYLCGAIKKMVEYDILKRMEIIQFGEFNIVSLKKFEKEVQHLLLFRSVSSIEGLKKDQLDELKQEVKTFHDKCMAALLEHGDKACFLIC